MCTQHACARHGNVQLARLFDMCLQLGVINRHSQLIRGHRAHVRVLHPMEGLGVAVAKQDHARRQHARLLATPRRARRARRPVAVSIAR